MAKFSDILGELAPYWTQGVEQYMGEERALDAQERAFTRQAPLRKKKKAEEIETAYGPAYSKKFLEGGLTGGLEGLKKEREAAEIAAAGGEISQLFPGITTPGPEPTGTSEMLREPRPFEPKTKPGLETMVKLGLQREKAAKGPNLRGLTMTQIRAMAYGPGPMTPEKQWASGIMQGYTAEQVDVAGRKIQEQPISPTTAKELSELEGLGRRITAGAGSGTSRAARAEKYLSPSYGGSAGAREWANQLSGGVLMGVEEQNFRGIVKDITDTLLRARSGAQINEQEYARLLKFAPNTGMAPKNFLARLALFEDELRKTMATKRRLAVTPRKNLATPLQTTGQPSFTIGDETFIEEGAEEE